MPPGSARILVVDDEPSLRQMMQVLLRREKHEVSLAQNVQEGVEMIHGAPTPFDLVVTDLLMPDGTGLEVLEQARRRSEDTQVIVVTAHASVETAVEAMQRGAYGYLEKPVGLEAARAYVQKALEKRLLLRDNASLRATSRGSVPAVEGILGKSPALQTALDMIKRAAASRVSVLITGESGTGKEVFARALHALSDRRDKSFVAINCAAIPEALLESELFGHEKGAFTGAAQKRDGLFREADGSTLFLDEVGELPVSLQVKLLRALQERKIRPVGASVELPVDVRIVAATNRDLEAEVKAGRFRQDLYYRLNVLKLRLPPLRERREDLAVLLEHFRSRYAAEQGRPLLSFSPEALHALMQYDFPGNVREVENLVERAVALASTNTIDLVDLPPEITGSSREPESLAVLPNEGMDLEAWLAKLERSILLQALSRTNGQRTRAASLLKLTVPSFRYRLAKLGLSAGEEETPTPASGRGRVGDSES